MKRILMVFAWSAAVAALVFAQPQTRAATVILMIAEQNIDGPQTAWWASEVDLSATEATIAGQLLEQGFEIIDPAAAAGVIEKNKGFRMLDLPENQSVQLASLAKADYLIVGKAIASAGARVPQSSMRSCFANISAKVIRVKDKKVIAFVQASGSSAHMEVITGGREALVRAAAEASAKIIDNIKKSELLTIEPGHRVSR